MNDESPTKPALAKSATVKPVTVKSAVVKPVVAASSDAQASTREQSVTKSMVTAVPNTQASDLQASDSKAISMTATAIAQANIALIKYWGKADEDLIIPRTSSLSLTLDGLTTETTVEFMQDASSKSASSSDTAQNQDQYYPQTRASQSLRPLPQQMESEPVPPQSLDWTSQLQRTSIDPNGLPAEQHSADSLSIDGVEQNGTALTRVSVFLDIVRAQAGINNPAKVISHNTVPFGAGLASSASAFAALAAAASRAAGLELSNRDLSRLARRGSGSACRSIYGGLVKWNAGYDDMSSYAEPIESDMDLAILIVLVSSAEKALSSRQGMRRTMQTSPLYDAWAKASQLDLSQALEAISHGDVQRLGEIAEANALSMHAAMMASRPAVFYWLPQTVAALRAVADLRVHGLGAWATMDAGPNVKVLTAATDAERIADELRDRLPGHEIQVHRAGHGVKIL